MKTLTGAAGAAGALLVSAMPVAAQTITRPGWATFSPTIGGVVNTALNIVFGVGVIIALFYLIWGAFNWITSGGDKGKTADARNKIVAAVVGLILLAATWAILSIVLTILGVGSVEGALDQYLKVTP